MCEGIWFCPNLYSLVLSKLGILSTVMFVFFFLMQVRLGEVLDDGRVVTKLLGEHQGPVHELAMEPGSPHIIYSCGEDGLVQHVSKSAV